MKLLISMACVAAVALGLMSCSRSPDAAAAPPIRPATHTITVEEMRFQPESLIVHAGDTVVWVNKDLFPHTATSEGHFNSQSIDAGKSWEFKPSAKGEFTYVCTFHPTMKARLQVD